jgi:hypothetical protein
MSTRDERIRATKEWTEAARALEAAKQQIFAGSPLEDGIVKQISSDEWEELRALRSVEEGKARVWFSVMRGADSADA